RSHEAVRTKGGLLRAAGGVRGEGICHAVDSLDGAFRWARCATSLPFSLVLSAACPYLGKGACPHSEARSPIPPGPWCPAPSSLSKRWGRGLRQEHSPPMLRAIT